MVTQQERLSQQRKAQEFKARKQLEGKFGGRKAIEKTLEKGTPVAKEAVRTAQLERQLEEAARTDETGRRFGQIAKTIATFQSPEMARRVLDKFQITREQQRQLKEQGQTELQQRQIEVTQEPEPQAPAMPPGTPEPIIEPQVREAAPVPTLQQLRQKELRGTITLLERQQLLGLEAAQPIGETIQVAREFITSPVQSSRFLALGIKEGGRKVVTGEGFAITDPRNLAAETIVGRTAGEIATLLTGAVLLKQLGKVVRVGKAVGSGNLRFKKTADDKVIVENIPTERGDFINIELLEPGIGKIEEPLKQQIKVAGTKRDVISAARDFFNFLEKEKVIEKPIPLGAQQIERALFADPEARIRLSRLGITEQPTASLVDVAAGDITLKKATPQALLFENVQIASLEPSLKKLIDKAAAGDLKAKSRVEGILLKRQLTPDGKFQPVGYLSPEPEVTLAPGSIVARDKVVGTFLVKGEPVNIIRTKVVKPTPELQNLIKEFRQGSISNDDLLALQRNLKRQSGGLSIYDSLAISQKPLISKGAFVSTSLSLVPSITPTESRQLIQQGFSLAPTTGTPTSSQVTVAGSRFELISPGISRAPITQRPSPVPSVTPSPTPAVSPVVSPPPIRRPSPRAGAPSPFAPSSPIISQPVVSPPVSAPPGVSRVISPTPTVVSPPPGAPSIPVPPPPSITKLAKEFRKKKKLPKGFVSAWKLFVRDTIGKGKKTKFRQIGGLDVRGKQIKKGAKITRETIAATFRVEETKRKIKAKPSPFTPDPRIFRQFKIVKGQRVATPNQWIERRSFRLDSPQEVRTLKLAPKTRKKKRKSTGGTNFFT